MEGLVPLLNKLQDALTAADVASSGLLFDLPQIAVVGAQSVGKSSVLEALVGREFLPRGNGIVTRRPLILQLRRLLRGREEYGEFGHNAEKKFVDFSEIRREIERETERVSGPLKNVSAEPILLKIFSPHVADLTLIDLPGITKVPVGDQPSDIELQIRRIVLHYISKPNTIILAVTAANTDIANSDSLKIARELDPQGLRTIGVVTKIDTLESGTDCADVLKNRVIPLKLGYVGVICRGQRQQQELQSEREEGQWSLHAAAKEEMEFFRSQAAYASIAPRQGISYLAKTLNKLLLYHIRQGLPGLRSRLGDLTLRAENELATFGDSLVEAKANPGALLLHFFSKFARNFQDAIDGKLQAHQSSEHLMGGARINFIFHDWYSRALAEFDPLEGLSDHEIRTAIRNATGPKAALFVPEGAFEILVRKQIQQLETPSLQCVDQVYEELQKIVEKCELPEMARFSRLRDRVMDVVRGVLRRCLTPTYQMIHNIIQIELAYINTNHPDFMNNRFAAEARPPSAPVSHRCEEGGSSSIDNTSQSHNFNNISSNAMLIHSEGHNNCSLSGGGGGGGSRCWGVKRLPFTTENQNCRRAAASTDPFASETYTLQSHQLGPSLLQHQMQQQSQQHTNTKISPSSTSSDVSLLPAASSQGVATAQQTAENALSGIPQATADGDVITATANYITGKSLTDSTTTSSGSGGGMLPQGGFFSFLKGSSRPANALNSSANRSDSSQSSSSHRLNTHRNQPQHSSFDEETLSSSSNSSSRSNSLIGRHQRSSLSSAMQMKHNNQTRPNKHTSNTPTSTTTTTTLKDIKNGRSLHSASAYSPPYQTNSKGGRIRLPEVPAVIAPSEKPSERELIETDLIKSLIWSYFQIVRKNVADAVPKSVMYFMVNTAKDVLQRELVAQLYREELFGELMKEGEDICERRTRCKQLLKSLRSALDILAQLREFGVIEDERYPNKPTASAAIRQLL